MHILDEGKPPKARLLAPRMLDDMNYVKHRYGNNKRRLNLKKVFKDELYDFSTDDDNCLILLPFWKFQHFLGKQVHGRWRVIILARGTGVTIGQLIRNNMVVGTRGWFLKSFSYHIRPMMSWGMILVQDWFQTTLYIYVSFIKKYLSLCRACKFSIYYVGT